MKFDQYGKEVENLTHLNLIANALNNLPEMLSNLPNLRYL